MTDETQLPPGDVAPTAEAPQSGEAVSSADTSQTQTTTATATDAVVAANTAVAPEVATEDPNAVASAENALAAVAPKTFEERVEARFLALEHALMGLPHSIMHVMHQGSMEAEEFAQRVLAHLFGKSE